MKKYRCKICGYIYDEEKEGVAFTDLPSDWKCPLCGVGKEFFEEVTSLDDEPVKDKTPSNAVKISPNNVAIKRDVEKCINCGMCKETCLVREGMSFDNNSELCVNCGQCIETCPVNSLMPVDDYPKFKKAHDEGKITIAYTSPAVRVAFGEAFNKEPGTFMQDELVGLLKLLGFDYVFDTTFAADLTIMEEASELVERITNNGTLPMFTSCCPAWVKYARDHYKSILPNISTCKSPIGMMGPMVKKYFTKENNIDESNVFTVAITPCTAKKYEITLKDVPDTDAVITIREIIELIKEKGIKESDIKPCKYDEFFKEGSGSGMIFGNTGGVMEAALRTAYYLITKENLPNDKIVFNDVRGYKYVREATIKINDFELNVAVVHGMKEAKSILEDVKNGTLKYHYIEIMNCVGGCIGGGGQPKHDINNEQKIKEKRINALYNRDQRDEIRCSHDNPQIKKIYSDFLEKPLSDIAIKYLHVDHERL